jgi:hypothetical protein
MLPPGEAASTQISHQLRRLEREPGVRSRP